jgi:hypothetical protein
MATANTDFELFPDLELNRDHQRRDELLGLNITWSKDNVDEAISIESIPLPVLEELLKGQFIHPEDRQNASPTARQFLEFMRKYPVAVAHGYAISPERSDYRITIEGLRVPAKDVTPELRQSFSDLCRDADELTTDGDLYSWWD